MKKQMVFEPMTEEQKKLVDIPDEELLKKRKRTNESGALWGLGVFCIIAAVSNQTFLGVMYESGPTLQLLVTIGILILCVVSCIFAVIIIRKPATSYAENISAIGENGFYTPEEIHDYYREVREYRDNLIFLFDSKKVTESNKYNAGVFTKNWMKVHANQNWVKIKDIVAAWHNESPDGTELVGFFLLRIDGLLVRTICTEEFSAKLLTEIEKRNPLTFLAPSFAYEGKRYDVFTNPQQVIDLYQANLDTYLTQQK